MSRRDLTPSGDVITTFDVRLTRPNREPALDAPTLHAMEHLAATFLRNHQQWGPRIVYWGPMGCLTGNYLIVQGELEPADVVPLLRDCFEYIAGFEGDIPGATPRDCGNWSMMDLEESKRVARRFVDEVLSDPKPCNLVYPQ